MENINREDWVWLPRPGHFILGDECKFRMATCVGNKKYIVSTVGELWGDSQVRRIHAEVYDKEWYEKNKHLKGDTFDSEYFKKFGFQQIGHNRTYETMVFNATKNPDDDIAQPYIIDRKNLTELDGRSYNNCKDAYKGHLELCEKWSKR